MKLLNNKFFIILVVILFAKIQLQASDFTFCLTIDTGFGDTVFVERPDLNYSFLDTTVVKTQAAAPAEFYRKNIGTRDVSCEKLLSTYKKLLEFVRTKIERSPIRNSLVIRDMLTRGLMMVNRYDRTPSCHLSSALLRKRLFELAEYA